MQSADSPSTVLAAQLESMRPPTIEHDRDIVCARLDERSVLIVYVMDERGIIVGYDSRTDTYVAMSTTSSEDAPVEVHPGLRAEDLGPVVWGSDALPFTGTWTVGDESIEL